MACISPDGKPTESGKKMLEAAMEPKTAEEIADVTALPLFRVRSGLRELAGAGFLNEADDKYSITDTGSKILGK